MGWELCAAAETRVKWNSVLLPLLQIIKIPGAVNFYISKQTRFWADADIEKAVTANRRNVDGHLPAMQLPGNGYGNSTQFFLRDIIKPI